jgi:hypothetical protein
MNPQDLLKPPPSIIFSEFKGIKNAVPAQRIAPGELVEATNIDIDDTHHISLRLGKTPILGSACGSVFATEELLFYITGTTLKCMTKDELHRTLMSGVEGKLWFKQINDLVYFSDGKSSWITNGDSVWKWGMVPPTGQPYATASDGLLEKMVRSPALAGREKSRPKGVSIFRE